MTDLSSHSHSSIHPDTDVDYEHNVQKSVRKFEDTLLANDTSVRCLTSYLRDKNLDLEDCLLNYEDLKRLYLPESARTAETRYLFVSQHLGRRRHDLVASREQKLQVSREAWRHLAQEEQMSPSFQCALAEYFLPPRRAIRATRGYGESASYTLWYFLPTRVQVPCTEKQSSHTRIDGTSNQIDPFHFVHLPDVEVDIRASRIGLHIRHNVKDRSTSAVVLNFMDGRWSKIVGEPVCRIKDIMSVAKQEPSRLGPLTSHLILLSSVSRWYTNSVTCANRQLVAYERYLQKELDRISISIPASASETDRALHAMAAHLHRFRSELDWLSDTAMWLHDILRRYHPAEVEGHESLEFIITQLKSTNSFVMELEKKVQNILALLFNRIAQVEARLSRTLAGRAQIVAEEMRKDSVAMKNIAIATMAFLPGASFAAVLSMPFFTENAWMQGISHLWVWILLTAPATFGPLAYYCFCGARRDNREILKRHDDYKESV